MAFSAKALRAGFTKLIGGTKNVTRDNMERIAREAAEAAGKNFDDMALGAIKSGAKGVGHITEDGSAYLTRQGINDTFGDIIEDYAARNADDAARTVETAAQRTERLQKLTKEERTKLLQEKRKKFQGQKDANGHPVSRQADGIDDGLDGMQPVSGPRPERTGGYNPEGTNFEYRDGQWYQRRYNAPEGSPNRAVTLEPVDGTTSRNLTDQYIHGRTKADRIQEASVGERAQQRAQQRNQQAAHNARQQELNEVMGRSPEELEKANRGWTQRTLDGAKDKAGTAWDHLSGNNRRRTTSERRAYNQYAFDQGGAMINTNRAYKQAKNQYGGDSVEEMFGNVSAAEAAQQVAETEHKAFDGIVDYFKENQLATAGALVGGGLLVGNLLDDE